MVWDTLDTTATDSDTTESARGLLRLSPRLLLIPTTTEDTAWATTDMVWDTLDTTATDSDTTELARGLLRLSPRLQLIPTTTEDTAWATTDMVWDTPDTTATDSDMDTAISDKSSLPRHLFLVQQPKHFIPGDKVTHPDLSAHHPQPSQMDCFSSSFIPHQCCQFQCCQPSCTRNDSRKHRRIKQL